MTDFEFERSLRAELSPISVWFAALGQKLRYFIGFVPIEKRGSEPDTDNVEKTITWGSGQKPLICAAPAADHRFSLAIHSVSSAANTTQLSSDAMTQDTNSARSTASSPPADS
jgi:hypothetical protein